MARKRMSILEVDQLQKNATYKLKDAATDTESLSSDSSLSESSSQGKEERGEVQIEDMQRLQEREGELRTHATLMRRNTTMFSFEERFKAFIGLKVNDNMQILQEKRR